MAGRDLFAATQQAQSPGRNLFQSQDPKSDPRGKPPSGFISWEEKDDYDKTQEGRGIGEELVGAGEAALTMGSSMIAEPVSGLVGLGVGAAKGLEAGVQAIEETKQAMTYQPRTEAGKEDIQNVGEFLAPVGKAIQSSEEFLGDLGMDVQGPELATALGVAPTLVMELLGLKGIRSVRGAKKITGITDDAADALKAKGVDIDDLTDAGVAKVQAQSKADVLRKAEDIKPPEQKSYKTILKDIESGKAKRAAGDVMPDKEIMEAAKDLGVDLNPSHYSTNKAYIEIEQSLKSRPGSTLNPKELKAIEDLGVKADELILDLGGTVDKSLLDLKVKNNIADTVRDLTNEASLAYGRVNYAIPKRAIIKTPVSKSFIESQVSDLGGRVDLLTSAEKDLLKLTKSKDITYAALDRIRKDIGKGFKGKGLYKDDNTGTLKQVYGKISEDQQKISKAFVVGDFYEMGRKLVSDRKKIEDGAISLFGKEMNKSIIPKMKQSATNLTKGDVSSIKSLMGALPEHLKPEAAATMLGDLFVQDARSATGVSQGFVKAFERLNRNKGAKTELFRYLPQDARRRFNNIGRVATGLYNAKALENTSRTARDLISAMDDGGMFKRIADAGKKVAVAESVTSPVGMTGAGTAGVLGSMLVKGRKAASVSADEFITSDIFTKAVKEAAEGNVKNANEMIKKSKAFKKWIKFANKGDIEAIATVGFIPWVTGQTGEEDVK